jgi:hypothetical protein
MTQVIHDKITTEIWTVFKEKSYYILFSVFLPDSIIIIAVLYGKGKKITTPKLLKRDYLNRGDQTGITDLFP